MIFSGFADFYNGSLAWKYFSLDHTSSFEKIHTEIGDSQFSWYYFMYDHRYYNEQGTPKFCPSFKLFRSFPLSKVAHAYQNFLE